MLTFPYHIANGIHDLAPGPPDEGAAGLGRRQPRQRQKSLANGQVTGAALTSHAMYPYCGGGSAELSTRFRYASYARCPLLPPHADP